MQKKYRWWSISHVSQLWIFPPPWAVYSHPSPFCTCVCAGGCEHFPRVGCAHALPELHMCESGDVLGGGGRVRVLGKFFVDWHGSSTNYINLWFHLLYLWQELSQLDVCFSMFTIFNVQMFKLYADKSINHSPTHFALVLCPSKNGVNDQWNVSWIYFSGFINF